MTPLSEIYSINSKRFIQLAVVSACALAVAAAMAPDRAWSNLLIIAFYATTVSLGAALFLALTYVCGASWNVAFRRVPEAIAVGLFPFGLMLLGVLAMNYKLYEWHPHAEGDPGSLWFKEAWSSPPFWMARAALYLGIWFVLSRTIIGLSRRQDKSGSPRLTLANRRFSAMFLVVFAPTFALACCDWLMLLDPMWFSTIWGVYHFAGMVQATLSVMVLLAVSLRNRGPLAGIFSDDHLHDVGKLLLGFSCFWMYIWFSQYMLIWYTNMPEETSYYLLRTRGPWGPLMIANIVLNWVVPFFVLLPRPCKRSSSVMVRVAAVVLVGRWLDLYLMVFPATVGPTPVLGLAEISAAGLVIGLFGALFYRNFHKSPAVPNADPLLAESLHHHC